jgi:hypothetical protein
MHQQIRAVARRSSPALAPFFEELRKANVNILGVGGGDYEVAGGGEIAIAPWHGDVDRAMHALASYNPRLLEAENGDFKLCWLSNEPGSLHKCIAEATEENIANNLVIKDIVVGIEPENGRYAIQVYSVPRDPGGSQS